MSVQLIPGNVHMVPIYFMLLCFDEEICEREIQNDDSAKICFDFNLLVLCG